MSSRIIFSLFMHKYEQKIASQHLYDQLNGIVIFNSCKANEWLDEENKEEEEKIYNFMAFDISLH